MKWTVAELFSGCGGMAAGFLLGGNNSKLLRLLIQSTASHVKDQGVLTCNTTYELNIGLQSIAKDIATLAPSELSDAIAERMGQRVSRGELSVLLACPPCTDFSRAKPANHLADGERNGLVSRVASFVDAFLPELVIMENARELMAGNHTHHAEWFISELQRLRYQVSASVHMLSRFGLPQIRERALIFAARNVPSKHWMISGKVITCNHPQ